MDGAHSVTAPREFDWAAIRERIERGLELAEPDRASPERKRDVLRERAQALARVPAGEREPGQAGTMTVLAFDLGGARYAVDTGSVVHACALPPLTALPGLPNHVAGIAAFRGHVLAVLDLRALLALPVTRLAEPAALVVLQDGAMEFGLLTDAVVGVQHYPCASLSASLPGLGALRAGYLVGVAPDRTAILDASRMLGDRSLVLHGQ
jgi:purine-binding chemotaxis protein CheW